MVLDRFVRQKNERGWYVLDGKWHRAPILQPTELAGTPVMIVKDIKWTSTFEYKRQLIDAALEAGYNALLPTYLWPHEEGGDET